MTEERLSAWVAWAAPDAQDVVPVAMAPGSTVGDAIAQSGLVAAYALDLAELAVAVSGQRRTLDAPVRDGDRIELLPPLRADPKSARRQRAARRGPAGGSRR